MNEFEDKLNNSLRKKMEKYEEELNTIKSDYEQKQEQIRQKLYEIITENQPKGEIKNEPTKSYKRNKIARKLSYYSKKYAKIIKKNILKLKKK